VSHRYVERPSLRGLAVTGVLYAGLLAAVYLPPAVGGTLRTGDLVLAPVLALVALPFAALSLSKRR
jgi:hypothetical protein